MPLWEIVSPRGRVFSPFGRVFSPFGRAFSPLKNGLGSNISEETLVCPKRSFLWETYLLGKRQKLSPLWKRQVYIYILYNILYIYIYIHLIIYTDTHICAYSQYIMSFLWFNKGKKIAREILHQASRSKTTLRSLFWAQTCVDAGPIIKGDASTKNCQVDTMQLEISHGKSPFLIGKPSINGPFSIAMLVYQRLLSKMQLQLDSRYDMRMRWRLRWDWRLVFSRMDITPTMVMLGS